MAMCGERACPQGTHFVVRIRFRGVAREGFGMSSHSKGWWLDRWWPLLVIAFGVGLVLLFALFHPHY
jgi:hypothetical protein